MTDGHKHRMVTIAGPYVWWVRWLRKPIHHDRDIDRVDASPYPYCPCAEHEDCWTMSTLSALHRWTGFTLFYRTWKGAPEDEYGKPDCGTRN